jgi:plasmid maintenance system killer protein
MIKSFQHKGLQAFFETGSKAGIQPHHAQKLLRLLARWMLPRARGYELSGLAIA